jgi:cation:H+ antiporter
VAKTSLIDVELPFFFMSMAGFSYFILDKTISRGEGFALIGLLIIFIIYQMNQKQEIEDEDEMQDIENKYHGNGKIKDIIKYGSIVIGSIIVLSLSAKYLIDSILTLSELLKISSSTLTITVVAFGTSLPEILTSVAAIKRGNHGMAIGNVLGSNTFNLLLIGGLPAIITPLSIDPQTFLIGFPFLIISTFIAIFVLFDNKIRPWEGVAMLFFYGIFIAKIIGIM